MRSAIEGGGVPADRAEFDAPVGRVQLDMTIFGERGDKLDVDARDLEVPNLKGPTPLVLLPPVVLATRSAREFRDVTADLNAAPSPLREFSRTERLLIRVPAYTTAGEARASSPASSTASASCVVKSIRSPASRRMASRSSICSSPRSPW